MKLNTVNILESYIKGKDEDQYKILEAIYAETAELEFEIDSEDISFPTNVSGNLNIANVLSKDFNKKYQKVKTYYLTKPKHDQLHIHHQNWLVVMQESSNTSTRNNSTRIGTGYYHWDLVKNADGLQIQKHKIYIHLMIEIEDNQAKELQRIQSQLNYPWVEPAEVIQTLSNNPEYEKINNYLKNSL